MKYMIHTYPKREWFVLKYIVPEMIKQGIKKDDITIFSDRKAIGNLKAFIWSLRQVTEDTWHLQDDILLSKSFRDRTEVLGRLNMVVSGFLHYDFSSGSILNVGFTKTKFLFMTFPCIFIPKRLSDEFIVWINNEAREKYQDLIDTNKNDDLLFYQFMNDLHNKEEIYQCRECLVDHVDYLIGDSSLGHNIGKKTRAYYWNENERNIELEKRIKSDKN